MVCVANALVLATPFSIPARVKMAASLSLTIEELSTLQILRLFNPALFAILRASNVSAVSPLCEMVTKSVPSRRRGSLYLNSEAISTWQGILAIRSSR